MKKIRKFLLPVLLVCMICAIIVVFTMNYKPYNLSNIQKDPAEQLESSLLKTQKALQEGLIMTPSKTVKQSLKEGVMDVAFRSEQSKFESSLYLRDNAFTLTGSVPSDESNVTYTIWAGEEDIAISIPALFEKTIYGFSPATLKEDLQGSALIEMLGISYEDAIKLVDFLSPSKSTEHTDLKALVSLKSKLEKLLENCAVSVMEQTVALDTGDVAAYQVSYTLEPEQLCAILDTMVAWIEESGCMNFGNMPELKETVEKAKTDILNYNATTILDFYLHTDSQVIMKTACRIDWLSENVSSSICIDLSLGEIPQDSSLYSLNITVNTPSTKKQEYSIQYQRSNAHNLPNRKLVFLADGETYTLFDLRFNSLSNIFDLYLLNNSLVLSGSYTAQKDVVSVCMNIKDIGDVEITFQAKATPPELPAYTNICKLPKDRLTLLWESIWHNDDVPSVWNITVDISDLNGAVYTFPVSGKYDTVGQMLVAEQLATLDENGKVISAQGGNIYGEAWVVYIQGELADGNLYDIPMESEITILIQAVPLLGS